MLTKTGKAPVVFKGASFTNTGNSLALPTHATGDLILIFAVAPWENAITKPAAGGTIPSWTTSFASGTGGEFYMHIAWAVATASDRTSGTWTNGYGMQAAVLSGQDSISPIGGRSTNWGYSQTAAPALALSKTDGSSQVLQFCSVINATFGDTFSSAGYTARQGGSSGSYHRLVTKNVPTSAPELYLGSGSGKGFTATVEIIN